MTITSRNGTTLEALVLLHDDYELRAIAPGGEDVLSFTRVSGTWISEQLEPVAIEFAWQRRVPAPTPTVADCICPKELAAQLVTSQIVGGESLAQGLDAVYVFGPAGTRVLVSVAELGMQ
jgi:hypothetical protein